MKPTLRKTLSILLALSLLLCAAPLAFAAGDADDAQAIFVDFSFTGGEEIIQLPMLFVQDGLAEDYGYAPAAVDHNQQPVDGPTVLDALVAAHVEYYGEEFTAETAADYLIFSNGALSCVFGVKTAALGFVVNGAVPHDDVMTGWGYTGYSADTAVLEDLDTLHLFKYQDTTYYADLLPAVTLSETDVLPGTDVTISASGYSVVYYGCSDAQVIDENTAPLAGADVCVMNSEDGTLTKIATLDENGTATLNFTERRSYYLFVCGESDKTPVIPVGVVLNVSNPSYELIFDANGGFFYDDVQLISTDCEAGDELYVPEDPTREGYVFDGWEPELDDVMPEHDVTYTAQWKADDSLSFLQRALIAVREAVAKVVDFFRMVIDYITALFTR